MASKLNKEQERRMALVESNEEYIPPLPPPNLPLCFLLRCCSFFFLIVVLHCIIRYEKRHQTLERELLDALRKEGERRMEAEYWQDNMRKKLKKLKKKQYVFWLKISNCLI